jgi:hypothetical protein
MDFWFWSRVRYNADSTHDVLHTSYSKFAKSIHNRKLDVENGRLEGKWEIMVKPVPRNRNHLIKTKLMTEALLLARRWLMKNGDHDEIGILGITFSFDEESEDLKVDESSSLSPRQA